MLLESGIGLTDEEKATAKEILSKANATYQQLTVTKDMVEKDDTLLLQAFPTTFFIDKDGNIVDSIEGSNDYDGWKAKIDEVLKKVEENKVGLAIFIAGMLFVSLGIHRQEHKVVSKKSNIICLECIGIG